MSFFVKAAVHALKKYPLVNASIDGSDIVYHGYYGHRHRRRQPARPRGADPARRRPDVDRGHRKADRGVRQARAGREADGRGADRRHLHHQQRRLWFGSMQSTPIINPPQSAILGVHATKDRAVVENGQVVVRPMNYLAQSYDHSHHRTGAKPCCRWSRSKKRSRILRAFLLGHLSIDG
jgi:2-oxoglutarate dehydrogenase E2 component (dihydrolipoamide succinyltransferase)